MSCDIKDGRCDINVGIRSSRLKSLSPRHLIIPKDPVVKSQIYWRHFPVPRFAICSALSRRALRRGQKFHISISHLLWKRQRGYKQLIMSFPVLFWFRRCRVRIKELLLYRCSIELNHCLHFRAQLYNEFCIVSTGRSRR